MVSKACIVVSLVTACAAERAPEPREVVQADWQFAHAPWFASEPGPPVPVRFKDAATARYHMRRHFDDLRAVEQLLVAGKLDEGLTLAFLLTRKTDDAGLAPWNEHAERVVAASVALTQAPGLDDALRREARVGVECAGCHVATQKMPMFGPLPPLPPASRTIAARMARHVWAADRLWEGLVGADDARWARGLAILAETPLPFAPLTDAQQLASDVQRLAQEQLAARPLTLLDERGTAYGEILVRCAACHATLRRVP